MADGERSERGERGPFHSWAHDTIFGSHAADFHSTPSPTPREHVYKAAVRTPLVKLDLPFAASGAAAPEVYLKLESLQPIGSFKIRGAWNAVRKLTPEQMRDGVWTVSAGNAAQGVAFAARLPAWRARSW